MMQRLFARIRWRLVGWTMLVVGLIILLLGSSVYLTLQQSLLSQVDRNLAGRATQALPVLFPPRGPGERGRLEGREGYRGGVFYLALGPTGQEFANPQQVSLAANAVPSPRGRSPVFATIDLNGEHTRVFVQPMPDGGRLVVGQSLATEAAALESLLVVLAAGGALGLLLTFAGAWFLAGRALVPIQQMFQRQQQFVADASHELRTPLTVLQSTADLLDQRRQEPLAANADLLDDLREEIARMVRLTTDLLSLARTDQGELELMTAPLDLAALASDVVRRAAPLAEAKDVHLAARMDRPPTMVDADPDRLQQVLLILLDNAIKHTPPGGRVTVQVQQQSHHALVRVVDTGEGIAAEHLTRIFDRFYRVDPSRARGQGGSGLGLAIAKMLVDAHGGDIAISSEPGAGTRVAVRLPVQGHVPSPRGRLGHLATRLVHPPVQRHT